MTAIAHSESNEFSSWLTSFCNRADDADLPKATIERFFHSVQFNPEVLAKSNAQPEFGLSAGAYVNRVLTQKRITRGRRLFSQFANALEAAELQFGVSAAILTAIWGIETDYGRLRGDLSVFDALATLAASGSRQVFWETELIAALQIVASGVVPANRMNSSWAGAMGHTQFMPSSYLLHAVRLSGNGDANIWGDDPSDSLASTANYLTKKGWRTQLPSGAAVTLPTGFRFSTCGHWKAKPATYWKDSGVRLMDGRPFSDWGDCSLILPAGHKGPCFLITANFHTLLQYNRSLHYSLATTLLAESIDENLGCNLIWPNTFPLSRQEIKELQILLVKKGFETGGIDGIAGWRTLQSIQAIQMPLGFVPDGYPNKCLLNHLRN